MKRRLLILVFLGAVVAGLAYIVSLFDSPVRYLVVLPMFVSMFFIPNDSNKIMPFLKFVGFMFVVFLFYCTIVLSLVESNLPLSKSWVFALVLTVWASVVRLVNAIGPRSIPS